MLLKFFKSLFKDFRKIVMNDEQGIAWVPLAMAAYGMYQGHQQEQQRKAQNKVAATQTEFSPYTGNGPGQLQLGGPTAMSGAVQGGLSGMSMQQSINDAGGWDKIFGGGAKSPAAKPVHLVDAAPGATSGPQQLAPKSNDAFNWGDIHKDIYGNNNSRIA